MLGTTTLGAVIITSLLGAAGAVVSLSEPSSELRHAPPPVQAAVERQAVDLSTVDAAIEGLYACISGPKGQERDWEAFDAIFADNARMAAVAAGPDGSSRFIEMTPEDYKQRSGPFLVQTGFTEKETHRVLEVYGTVAHAWSTYHGTFERPDGQAGEVSGINSIQLVKMDGRWRVTSIQWESVDTAGPIPGKYAGEDG